MAAKAQQSEVVSTTLIQRWQEVGKKIAAIAEEFPEEKYEFRPLEEVRSISEVLRHVAFWNQYVADSARGKKADDTTNELSKAEYSTKAAILSALQRSSSEARAALNAHKGDWDPALVELVVTFLEHTSEHYGQLVVYRRLASKY